MPRPGHQVREGDGSWPRVPGLSLGKGPLQPQRDLRWVRVAVKAHEEGVGGGVEEGDGRG